MKKFLMMTVAFCTLLSASLADAAAKVTDARWGVDKNNVLRLVVDLTESAKYEMKMSDFNKLNLIVDAPANANVYKSTPIRSSLANTMRVYNEGKKTIVEVALTKQITDKDFRSFVLKNDPASGRPQRIVMDITADRKEAASVTTAPTNSTNVKAPVVVSNKPTGKRPPIIKTPVKTSAPQNTEAKANDATKVETPKVNTPVSDAPKTETPKVNVPANDVPKAQTPKVNASASDAKTEVPKVSVPKPEAKSEKVELPKASAKKIDKRSGIKIITKDHKVVTNTGSKDKKTTDNVKANKKETGLPAIKATQKYSIGGGIKGKTIVLDAGHGGSDPGAIGASGLKEKEVTLAITKLLKQELEDKGAKVHMTRTTDVDVYKVGASDRDELQARVNVAEKHNADAFISIHINASVNKNVGGFSTYYHPKTEYDLALARNIQNNLTKNFKVNDLGVREAGFYVIKRSSMPAVLVEMLFISNQKEEALLKNTWFRKKSARMIAEGVENYFK